MSTREAISIIEASEVLLKRVLDAIYRLPEIEDSALINEFNSLEIDIESFLK